jgi:two-component system chemotaxis sensor kinase CheA
MDDLLSEFLTETAESLEVIDTELVKFESHPNDRSILDNIFRLVHTIKGTCGFLGLPRLEGIAHAGETLLGRFRDGRLTVTPAAVTLVLESIDQIKRILAHLEAEQAEPEGDDSALIARLEAAAEGGLEAAAPPPPPKKVEAPPPPKAVEAPADEGEGRWDHDLGRALRPGEVSLADLEAAFMAADGPDLDQLAREAEAARAKASTPAPAAAAPAALAAQAAPAPKLAEEAAPEDSRQPAESQLANNTIRVGVDVLENLMTMVSELVLTRNQLMQMVRHMEDSEFKVPLQRLSNITAELQDGVMKTRMQPIGNAWKKLPRIVRDCAQEVGKKINLNMSGQETELDRQVLELIKDPLTHMVRNSCDHGVELPTDRAMQGKPEAGTINLRAFHEGGHIIIEIADDGAGLNTEKIRRKAVEKGLVTQAEAAQLSEAQVHRFIFAPGFSTAAKVTNLSGRGVGMDVVRTNIEQIGGTVDLTSVEGRGTTFTIKIPLTLAIVSALIVSAGSDGSRFAIPQISVVELVRAGKTTENRIEFVNQTRVLRLRDRLLPLVDLGEALKLPPRASGRAAAFVVVMQVGGQRFGVVVDEIYDTEEIVVKPLASVLRSASLFSGNTILGDGSVIMIMDPNGLANTIGRAQKEIDDQAHAVEIADRAAQSREQAVSMLIFRAGGPEPKAAPLSLITRLEEVDAAAIERSNGRLMVQYRGSLMPLVHVATAGQVRTEGKQPVLVFSDRGRSAGLMVDEIVDIVQEPVKIEIAADEPGMTGTAVLRGKATEIIDVGHYLAKACADWFQRTEKQAKARKKKILLVDDSSFFRHMMTPLLSAAGYEVTAVGSVAEAWRVYETGEDFDAIVSDIDMPDASGFEFAKQLKANPRWGAAPRVALTAMSRSEAPPEAANAFNDFIPKTDRTSLIAALEYALSGGEAA